MTGRVRKRTRVMPSRSISGGRQVRISATIVAAAEGPAQVPAAGVAKQVLDRRRAEHGGIPQVLAPQLTESLPDDRDLDALGGTGDVGLPIPRVSVIKTNGTVERVS